MPSPAVVRHPVWDIYDEWRTARLNCKYYSAKLAALERSNFWLELVIAATASGSAIAALAFWQTRDGRVAWTWLTVLSAIFAVAKPLLKLTERIQKLDHLTVAYSLLDHDYKKLGVAIRQDGMLTANHQQQLRTLMDRTDDLKKMEVVERRIDERLRRKCRESVEAELPETNFYVPSR
jgi:hypothetical protein